MTRRSTGCRNCVNRHTRCDGTRPFCKNCEKQGLKCGGPREGALFIINEHRPDHRPSQRRRRQQQEEIQQPQKSPQKSQQDAMICPSIHENLHNPSLSKSGEDVHICYLQKFWTVEDEIWINYSLTDPISYPTACLAIGTFATAYYGKRNRQPEIVVCAIRNYGRALVALQRALLRSNNSCTFDILAASTALQRYEVIICTTGTGWIKHSGGVARAIELSGPESFTRNPNKAILDANGYRIIQEAYHQRRRTFLALEKWRSLRTNSDDQSVHFDRLQHLYARLPGLAEGVTSFIADQDSGRQRKILDEANRLLADLETWINHWIAEFNFRPIERYTSSTRSIYNDAKGPAFRSFLHYPSPLAGIGANIYRAIKLTTLEWRHKLQHPSWWPGEDHERMDEVPSIHQLAMDSCRTLNSHFSDDSGQGVYQVWYLLFCSLTAYKAFYRRSREARWISAMLTDVGDRFGLELARKLTCTFSVKWKVEGTSEAR